MTFVWGSSPSAVSRSTSEMSALLPMLTSLARPKPRPAAWSRIAVHSAPDCEKIEMLPERGMLPANEAFIRWPVLISPRQLGPSSRTRWAAQRRAICASSSAPSRPVSRKPAVMTTIALVPARRQSWTAWSTAAAGTAMTPRSIAPPAASSEGKQGRSRIVVAAGFTGTIRPANPPAIRLARMSCPTFPGVREAPMTAMEPGVSSASSVMTGRRPRLAAAPSPGPRRAAPRAPRGCCRSARGRRSSRGRRPARRASARTRRVQTIPQRIERRGDARHQAGPAVVAHLDQRGAGAADPEEPAVGAEDVAHRDDADEPPVVIDDGKRPDAVAIEEQQRVVQRRLARQGDRGAAHDRSRPAPARGARAGPGAPWG